MLKSCLSLVALLLVSFFVSAQKFEWESEVLLQSRYIWRGEMLGNAPAIEPSVTFTSGKFSFNVWGMLTTNNSYSEFDLVPSYQFNLFKVSLLDYYIPEKGESNQYLNFQKEKNRHSLEINIDNYSIDEQRLKWMVGTFFSGDKNEETNKPFYSTYIEFKYPFTIFKINAEPSVGITPFKGMYANKFAFVNTAISFSKEFELSSRLSIPITASYTYNPYQDKQFVSGSTGLIFSSGK